MICLICGSSKRYSFCVKDGLAYFRCSSCGHVYVEKRLHREDLLQHYATRKSHHSSAEKEKWDYSKAKAKYVYLPLLKKIRSFTCLGRLLDIGCSNGAFVHAAQKNGWDAYGVELEKGSFDIAKRRGLKVYYGDLLSHGFPDHHFTAVTLWQVIEHLYDPTEVINEISRILKPDGVFALSTPNVKSIGKIILGRGWNAIEPQVHIHLFNPYGIEKYITRFGFKTGHVETLDIKPSTVKQYFKKLAGKKTANASNSVACLASLLPERHLKLMFQFNFIPNIILKYLGIGEDIYAFFLK